MAGTSSHDKTGFYLRGVQIYLVIHPARVRIWVISAVTAPNNHISCKSRSSRTKPSVTAMMIALLVWYYGNSRIKLTCLATV